MSHSYESKCQYSEKSNSENQCPSEFFTNKLGKWCFLHIIRINDTIEYMKKLRNLKHIFVIILISLTILFGYIMIFADEFDDGINGYFIYRTSNGTWQDIIHKHTLRPSASDIVIIKIDERTLNGIQNNENDLKNLALTKKTYSDLIKNLEWVWVRWIAFDIVFQNADPTAEQEFADTMRKYDNIVIGANYVEDLCQQAYGGIWTQLGNFQVNYPKNIASNQCDTKYQELYLKYQELYPEAKKIIPIDLTTGTLSNSEKLARYCTANSTGIIDCPGLPRSIYKDTPWWIINMPSSYKRTAAWPILGQPYQDWKIGSGSHTIGDTEMYPLAMSLYIQTNTGSSEYISQLPYSLEKLERITQVEKWAKRFKTLLQPYFGAEKVSYPSISLIDVLGMNKVERVANFKWKYVFVWVTLADNLTQNRWSRDPCSFSRWSPPEQDDYEAIYWNYITNKYFPYYIYDTLLFLSPKYTID